MFLAPGYETKDAKSVSPDKLSPAILQESAALLAFESPSWKYVLMTRDIWPAKWVSTTDHHSWKTCWVLGPGWEHIWTTIRARCRRGEWGLGICVQGQILNLFSILVSVINFCINLKVLHSLLFTLIIELLVAQKFCNQDECFILIAAWAAHLYGVTAYILSFMCQWIYSSLLYHLI